MGRQRGGLPRLMWSSSLSACTDLRCRLDQEICRRSRRVGPTFRQTKSLGASRGRVETCLELFPDQVFLRVLTATRCEHGQTVVAPIDGSVRGGNLTFTTDRRSLGQREGIC